MVTSNIVNLFYICGIISLLLNGCVVGVLVEDLPTSICCSNHTILRALPKIELHAHIHGSIRRRTLEELLSNRPDLAFDLTQKIDLVSGFKLFNVIHRVINSLELVERVTREVIDDFRADGVVYLELRTTPREIGEIGVKGKASKLEYLDSVCRVLHESNDKYRGVMISRLLVSIDRGSTIADAQTTIEAVEQILARKILARNTDTCIVGFDFSGNPHVNSFEMFRPIMEHARRVGRRVTVHAAEVKESLHLHDDETDMAAVLAFIPDRLGHALHLRETHLLQVLAMGIPVEITPTSNLFTLQLGSYTEHPTLARWLALDHPIVIGTDDTGVFQMTLTQELVHMHTHFDTGLATSTNMMRRAVSFIFDEEARPAVAAMLEETLLSTQFSDECLPCMQNG